MATFTHSVLAALVCFYFAGRASAEGSSDLDQGIQLYNQRNYQAAAQLLNRAASAERNNPSVYYYSANCAYAMGKRATAIKFYWFVAHRFSTSKEAYYSRNVLKQIDPDYSKNSALAYASRTPAVDTKPRMVSAAEFSKMGGSNLKQVDDLIQVLKSQGNRPEVSEQLISSAKAALLCYPPPLLSLLQQRGIKICLTPTTIDQDPRNQNTKPRGYEEGSTYKNCPGFFNGRTIVVCEYTLSGFDDSGWDHALDPIGTLRHEMGHAIDACLGGVSRSDEFKHAYYLDVGQIPEDVKPHISYFLQTSQGGPSETFAELVCYDFGGRTRYPERCQLVHSSFKQASAVIEQKLAQVGQR